MQTIVEIPKTGEQIRSVWGMTKPTEEEKWEYISKLSEIRSKYSCFEDDEEPYYRALSEGIKALKAISSAEPRTGHWVKTPKAVMGEGYMWYCNKCKYQVYQDSSKSYPSEKFCPDCGCRMVEPQESEVRNDKA